MNNALGDLNNVMMIEPLDYPNFIALINNCAFMLTGSSGV
ncbi:hypothetical protein [Parasphingorhabdus cellanae]|uniref:Uncharacterized protein n=1 Tax=Parasphingorhabdus cellanae TaxID=2806553 RepID=A0ABX7T2V8_9SPHN|nr:hypothetical protein J4G78_17140 [Parasphingorhabdus cellanae]